MVTVVGRFAPFLVQTKANRLTMAVAPKKKLQTAGNAVTARESSRVNELRHVNEL
eukprot:m.127893 g.127893  ORF g.127893 m.127893 type:complete len:55 (-) comp15809_c0_seq5:79-243(-)